MIRFTAGVAAEDLDSSAGIESSLRALSEVLQALSSFFTTIPEEFRARILGIIIPTLIFLLEPQAIKAVDSLLHKASIKTLLSLATSAPQAFREATGKLDAERKTRLEAAIREALSESNPGSAARVDKPTIALRSV